MHISFAFKFDDLLNYYRYEKVQSFNYSSKYFRILKMYRLVVIKNAVLLSLFNKKKVKKMILAYKKIINKK